MRRTVKVERTYKLSEYNSLKVGLDVLEFDDQDNPEVVEKVLDYLMVSVDKVALKYTHQQGKLKPMNDKDALLFLQTEQEEALKTIQLLLEKGKQNNA